MGDVVQHEELEGRRCDGLLGLECNLIEIVTGVDLATNGFGYRGHDTHKMSIVRRPEVEEFPPRDVLISLQLHPPVLVVSSEDKVRHPGRSHEALVIVARRIDEVPDDLAGRPRAGSWARRRFGIPYPPQQGLGPLDDGAKLASCEGLSIGEGCHGPGRNV